MAGLRYWCTRRAGGAAKYEAGSFDSDVVAADIRKADLRTSHGSNDRLHEAFDRLMSGFAREVPPCDLRQGHDQAPKTMSAGKAACEPFQRAR